MHLPAPTAAAHTLCLCLPAAPAAADAFSNAASCSTVSRLPAPAAGREPVTVPGSTSRTSSRTATPALQTAGHSTKQAHKACYTTSHQMKSNHASQLPRGSKADRDSVWCLHFEANQQECMPESAKHRHTNALVGHGRMCAWCCPKTYMSSFKTSEPRASPWCSRNTALM